MTKENELVELDEELVVVGLGGGGTVESAYGSCVGIASISSSGMLAGWKFGLPYLIIG